MQNKSDLRHKLIAQRNALGDDVRARCDIAISKYLMNWLLNNPAETLGVYWPINGEPDLRMVYSKLAAGRVQLALPVVVGKDAPLQFRRWTPGDAMTKDLMGVPTPVARSAVVAPDAVLVPCVGFNGAMIRLGYGGGFYDRTLTISHRPVAIGIAYACAATSFDAEQHDVALDVVLTESGIATIV